MNKDGYQKLGNQKFGLKSSWFKLKRIFYLLCFTFFASIIFIKLIFHLNIFICLLLSIIITICLAYLIMRAYFLVLKKAGYEEKWHDLYGTKLPDIPYFKNDIIINTYKKNGDNYNEEIGNVNEGEDYQKNERNYYDLYIPYSSLKRKDKFNGIILFIHGGAWIHGGKNRIEYMAIRYAKFGYITATMNHTYLKKKYKGYSIFRIMDEIRACLENIKENLKIEGFDDTKLEVAIGGMSSGAHLASLYGYSFKNSPIPVKFIINLSGVLSLDPEFWYKIKNENEVLDNIDIKDIDEAIKENKIIKMRSDDNWLPLMNNFIGGKFSKEEIKEMSENKSIKTENEKYKELFKIVKNTYPINFVNSSTVPTLCHYGGMDGLVGVKQYYYLKKLSEKFGNRVELVYMKYGGHSLDSYDTENGMLSIREMHYQILNFAKTYFTKEE